MCLGKDSIKYLLRFCGEDLEANELVLGISNDKQKKL